MFSPFVSSAINTAIHTHMSSTSDVVGGGGGGESESTALSVYMPQTPTLNIYDLYRNIQRKKVKRYEHFNVVLGRCYQRIRLAADNEQFRLFYEVPEFIVGVPMYNINHCIAYMITELRQKGMLVKYYFPRILYISWDPRECKAAKDITESPPTQSAPPPPLMHLPPRGVGRSGGGRGRGTTAKKGDGFPTLAAPPPPFPGHLATYKSSGKYVLDLA